MPCGAPEAKKFRCSTVSPVNPTGWPSFTWNGTPLACASFSGAVSVTPVPVAPAVPTDGDLTDLEVQAGVDEDRLPGDRGSSRRRP